MANDDERNVDEQLDDEQRRIDRRNGHLLIENHRNNTRTDAQESSAIAGAFGAVGGTTVTDPSKASSGQTVTGNLPEEPQEDEEGRA